MNSPKAPYKRKLSNFLINRPLQMKNVAALVGFSVLISIIFGIFVYLQTDLYLNIIKRFVTAEEVGAMGFEGLKVKLITCIVGIIIINSLILSAIGIVITHSVAGPLYRMEQQLKKLGQGDFSYLYFRKTDTCHSLEDAYNAGMDQLKQKFTDIEQASREKENRLRKLLAKIEDSKIRNEINDILKS